MVSYRVFFNALWSAEYVKNAAVDINTTSSPTPTAASTLSPTSRLRGIATTPAATTATSNMYFPAGEDGLNKCLLDDGSEAIPDGAELFATATLRECCDASYHYDRDGCLGIIKGPSSQR
jgi:hypothetical protein